MRIPKLVTEGYDQVHRIWHNLGYLYRFLVFITPWLTVALYFALVLGYLPPAEANKYGVSALAYLFPPFGKESIIPYMLSSGDALSLPSWLSWLGSSVGPALPPWTAWSMIIIMDVISSAIWPTAGGLPSSSLRAPASSIGLIGPCSAGRRHTGKSAC